MRKRERIALYRKLAKEFEDRKQPHGLCYAFSNYMYGLKLLKIIVKVFTQDLIALKGTLVMIKIKWMISGLHYYI